MELRVNSAHQKVDAEQTLRQVWKYKRRKKGKKVN